MIQSTSFLRPWQRLVLVLGIVALSSACAEKKADEDLQKAFQLHEEAMEMRQKAQEQLDQLKANKDSLFLATHAETLESFESSLEEWDEQVVEVPGFEHAHDHAGHDHSDHDHSEHDHGDHAEHDHSDHDHSSHDHHNHGSEPELTPKQHLEVQQYLLDEINAIAERISAL